MFADKHARMRANKRRSVKRLTFRSRQASLERALPASTASANRNEERANWAGPLWPQSALPQLRPVNKRSALLPQNNRPHGNCTLLAVFFNTSCLSLSVILPVSPSVYLQQMPRPLSCSTRCSMCRYMNFKQSNCHFERTHFNSTHCNSLQCIFSFPNCTCAGRHELSPVKC